MFNFKLRFSGNVGSLIRSGDLARNAKQWSSAIGYYERVVAKKPSLAAIWVQLGHARKENGDLTGAETAYQAAFRLEPSSADTALQMGHLCKVGQKIEEAAAWYRHALAIDHHCLDARKELATIAQSRNEDWVVPRNLARTSQPIRRLFWDITLRHARAGEFCIEEKWFSSLAKAASSNFDVIPVAFDPNRGGFFRCSLDDEAAELTGDELTLLAGNYSDSAFVTTPAGWNSPTPLIRMLSSARSRLDMTIIGIARTSNADSDNLDNFRVLAQHATVVLLPHVGDRQFAEDVARQLGRTSSLIFSLYPNTCTSPHQHSIPAASPSNKRILVLAPECASDYPAIDLQLRTLHGRASVLVLEGESLTQCSTNERTTEPQVITPAKAWAEIGNCSIQAILIPASRADGEVWASHALSHGIQVLSDVRNRRVFSINSSGISYFSAARAAELTDFQSTRCSPVPSKSADDIQFEGWIEALKEVMTMPLRYPAPSVPANLIRYGVYYGAEAPAKTRLYSEAEGRPMLMGSGWGPTSKIGTRIVDDCAQLSFQVPFPIDEPIQCKVLLCIRNAECNDDPPHLHWLELEAEQLVIRSTKEDDATYSIPVGKNCRAHLLENKYVYLAGYIAYPYRHDHHWHEFLDRASRSIHSFRNLSLLRRPPEQETVRKNASLTTIQTR